VIILGSKYTEAQKRATMNYLKDSTDELKIRMPKGKKKDYREAAEKANYSSLNQFVIDAIEEKISKL
jgi:predicted HicB family RNase H-like nuclease